MLDKPGADILTIDGLTKRFGGLLAVNNVGFTVGQGEIVALIGPNGAGKSTIVNLLSGVLPPTAGTVRLEGRALSGLAAHAVARAGLVRTFQNGRLMPRLSVLENVLLGADAVCGYGFLDALLHTPRLRLREGVLRDRAEALLVRFGLQDTLHREVRSISYGQQRTLELARAMMQEPRVLLLDEPAAGLNSAEAVLLGDRVRALRQEGLSVLLIEHNMGLVMSLADRIVVVDFGVRIAEGPPAAIRADERVIEAYLGRKAAHAVRT